MNNEHSSLAFAKSFILALSWQEILLEQKEHNLSSLVNDILYSFTKIFTFLLLARVVVLNGNVEDNQYYPMVMSSATSGSVRVEVPDGETQVLLVVSAVPEYFKSHQTYGYQVWIYQGDEAPVTVPTTSTTPTTTTTPGQL